MSEPHHKRRSFKTIVILGIGFLFAIGAIAYAVYFLVNKKDQRGGRAWRQSAIKVFESARDNDLATLKQLIEKGSDPNLPVRRTLSSSWPIRPVEVAAYQGHLEIIQHLESVGVNLKESRALFFGVQSKSLPVVQYLLEAACDPNQQVTNGKLNPAHVVLLPIGKKRKLEPEFQQQVIKLLLEYGLDLDGGNIDSETVTQRAIRTEQWKLAQFLLDKKSPYSAENDFGFQDLVLAANADNRSFIEKLIQKKAKLTVKHAVLLNDRPLILKLLQEDPSTKEDPTVVQFAVQNRLYELAIFLMDQGVTPKFDNPSKNSGLHYAVKAKSKKLLLDLLDRDVDINAVNGFEKAPLHYAIEHDYGEGIDILAEHGCDLDIQTRLYGSPIEYAISTYQYPFAIKLIQLGSDPNSEIAFPLHKYCSQVTSEPDKLIDLLLDRTENINRLDGSGKTALHYALGGFINMDLIRKLLEHGADITLEDSKGHSAYQVARISENIGLIELMLEYAD